MSLDELFDFHHTDKAEHGYAPFYEHYLDRDFRDNIKSLLEIGVFQGASLRAWRDWLPGAEIHGVDTRPVEVEGCTVYRADATDSEFTRTLGEFDVIIDDASHRVDEQKLTFIQLWSHLRPGGWYVIEDLAPGKGEGGVPLFLHPYADEVHRHGEIVFAHKEEP